MIEIVSSVSSRKKKKYRGLLPSRTPETLRTASRMNTTSPERKQLMTAGVGEVPAPVWVWHGPLLLLRGVCSAVFQDRAVLQRQH